MSADEAGAIAASDPAAASAPPTARPRGSSLVQKLIYALPAAVLLATGWAHRWITEDSFIYLRIVQQIRAGHGPVFNAGERVEAFTGTLWVGVLALADLLTPIRLEWLAVALSLTFAAAGVVFAMLGAQRLWDEPKSSALFIPLGALVFVALLPVWVFATSGLETGLAFGWLGVSLWILGGWSRSPGDCLSTPRAVVLGLGWLIRPELVLFSAAFLAIVVVFELRARGRRNAVRIVVAMLALPVGYQVFRMGYYGSLVPNTAIAKEGSRANWARGTAYLHDFVDPYWLWVPGIALVAGGYIPLALAARQRLRVLTVAGAFVLCGALQWCYFAAVGGDYLHARLLLPGFFALCAPVAAVPATRRCLAALLVAPWAVAALFMLRPEQYTSGNVFANGFVMVSKQNLGTVTTDDYGWGIGGKWNRWYRGPGYYYEAELLRYPRADIPLRRGVPLPYGAFFGIGVAGYAPGVDFHVLDLMGLADSFAAHLESTPSSTKLGRFPGHEKPLPAPWVAARLTPEGSRPNPAAFPNFADPLIPVTTGREFQEQVAWARAALHCDGIERLFEAADGPLTAKRFVTNFLRSFTDTGTRIPPDPEAAYHKFCGAGIPPDVRKVRAR